MLEVGMLWRMDDRKLTLEQHVACAAAHYAGKYGAPPNACQAHPSDVPAGSGALPKRKRNWRLGEVCAQTDECTIDWE